jgi:hypothetical protein
MSIPTVNNREQRSALTYAKVVNLSGSSDFDVKFNRVTSTVFAILSGVFLFFAAPIMVPALATSIPSCALVSVLWMLGVIGMQWIGRSQSFRLGELHAVNKLKPFLPDLSYT